MRPPGPANTWSSRRGCPYPHASEDAAPDELLTAGGGGGGESGRLRPSRKEMWGEPPMMIELE
eukprot:5175561-Prymnesium_polylepis.1